MITDKVYNDQIERLEGALNYKLYQGSYKVWKKEINDNGYSDARLVKGIDRIIYRLSDGSLKPRDVSIGTILGACRAVYQEPIVSHQDMPLAQVTNPDRQGLSPYARGCCEIIQAYTTGLIDKATYQARHKALNQKYGLYNANKKSILQGGS